MSDIFSVYLKPRSRLIRATVLGVPLGLIHVLATPLYFSQWLGYAFSPLPCFR